MKYWLVKSELVTYGIKHLEKDGATWWEGVRNYQARNFMRDDMKKGDPVLFYHSNAVPPGIAGFAVVSKNAEPDQTQFDKKSEYYDPKSKPENPPWVCPEIQFVEALPELLTLEAIRANAELAPMLLLQTGQRLSVQPVEQKHFEILKKMAAEVGSKPREVSAGASSGTAVSTVEMEKTSSNRERVSAKAAKGKHVTASENSKGASKKKNSPHKPSAKKKSTSKSLTKKQSVFQKRKAK